MLELRNIKKDYLLKNQEPVHALKGISLCFRSNEFVAILGHSGCGKTTLLNITGGLDRYSDGDLIIEGVSTKNYSDRDWDTYRNHSIGFVFQSYNLIGHQSILKNVELALTISGISKEERKQRALKALDRVGLSKLAKHKPNQLSGGQMQRVAIARALVNDPEIVLADEPTGALDSETSVQIMNLLKEVAKDRLVIMVTHNPELADKYATRIVKMKDGVILSDSNPFDGKENKQNKDINSITKGKKKKSSMSFFTATGLSFSNLLSKLRRTILVAVAGSIGIIGVSLVLSISNGISGYIDVMQEDMLSSYPLTIAEESIDYTTLISGLTNDDKKEIAQFDSKTQVGINSMISYLMDKYKDVTRVKKNEINNELINFIEEMPSKDLSAISYNYGIDVTNNIFTTFKQHKDDLNYRHLSLNGLTQRYISSLTTIEGFKDYAKFVSLFTNFLKQLPSEEEYTMTQYDLLAGTFPTKDNEMLLVIDKNSTLTDVLLGQLGFYCEDDFLNIARKAIEENKDNPDPELIKKYDTYPKYFNYSEFLNKELTYYPQNKIWTKGTTVKGMTLDIVTIAGNFNLIYNPSTNCIQYKVNNVPMSYWPEFTRDTSTLFDKDNPMKGNWKATIDNTEYNIIINGYTKEDVTVKYNGINVPINNVFYSDNADILIGNDYCYNAEKNETWGEGTTFKIAGIVRAKSNIQFGCLNRGLYYTKALTNRFIEDSKNANVVENLKTVIANKTNTIYTAYVKFDFNSYVNTDNPKENLHWCTSALNTSLSLDLGSLITSAGGINYVEANKTYLRSLSGLATKEDKLGNVTFEKLPQKISLYPKNFETKNNVTKYLDRWNSDEIIHGQTREDRNELSYNDTISMIVSVIRSLVTGITIALIAFTSLALLVSCFMIAVITYISTMERIKEIGIIRSLGGRKKDVSRLFIAECLITGLASGVIGIVITYLLSSVLNIVVVNVAGQAINTIASLPLISAVAMIVLSILLHVLSGLIPSMRASRQDPVEALRSE